MSINNFKNNIDPQFVNNQLSKDNNIGKIKSNPFLDDPNQKELYSNPNMEWSWLFRKLKYGAVLLVATIILLLVINALL